MIKTKQPYYQPKALIKKNVNSMINIHQKSEFKKWSNQKVQKLCIISIVDIIKQFLNNLNKQSFENIILEAKNIAL